MATITPINTAKAKASDTFVDLTGVSLTAGESLIVFVGFQQQNQPTSVTWGANVLLDMGQECILYEVLQ